MPESSNYIEGNNNNIVNGNDNTIIHNHYYIKESTQEGINETPNNLLNKNDNTPNPIKKEIKINPINEKFRNYKIDYLVGNGTLLITIAAFILLKLELYSFIIPIVISFIYLIYLPKKYPFMFIYVYEDKLIYNVNKIVNYSEIKEFKYQNNGFDFRLNKPKYTSLIFYNVDNSSFVFDTVRRYAVATNTLMPSS